jgi:hypothetical protein
MSGIFYFKCRKCGVLSVHIIDSFSNGYGSDNCTCGRSEREEITYDEYQKLKKKSKQKGLPV